MSFSSPSQLSKHPSFTHTAVKMLRLLQPENLRLHSSALNINLCSFSLCPVTPFLYLKPFIKLLQQTRSISSVGRDGASKVSGVEAKTKRQNEPENGLMNISLSASRVTPNTCSFWVFDAPMKVSFHKLKVFLTLLTSVRFYCLMSKFCSCSHQFHNPPRLVLFPSDNNINARLGRQREV